MQINLPPGRKFRTTLIRAIITVLLFLLVFWALKNAPLSEIISVLTNLQPWKLGIILIVNMLLYLLLSLRWWIIVQSQNKNVPFRELIPVRIAVFGISYFTLGPQVGGEPLQVLSLTRKYGISFTRASASVLLDKLLEFLANFVFLGVGMLSMLASGLISANFRVLLFWMAVLGLIISWPIIHILLLRKRIYPLRWCLNRLSRVRRKSKIVRFIYAAEWLAGRFCQQRTRDLFFSLAVSLLLGCGMVFDYGLMIAFLGIHLQFWQIIAGWTSAWLSFLAPLPGGLGALEASQVAALGVFGVSAAAAISVTLLMRARDMLFGGLGLIFAGRILK